MNDKQQNKLMPRLRFPEFKDSGEWDIDNVENLISTITPPMKLQTSDYLESGKFPIIDQSKSFYCGWTNNKKAIISKNLPLIIFGDHTCVIKLANEPFAQGADGIKILKAKDKITDEFLYQFLQYNGVVQENYKRHFSKLKEKKIMFPDVKTGEQQKIASCLSSLDELLEARKQKLELLKKHKKGLMQNLFPSENDELLIMNDELKKENSQFTTHHSPLIPRLRFPEFKDSGEWEEKELFDIADKKIKWSFTGGPFGSDLKASDYTSTGIRIIQLQNIGDGVFNDEYKIYTSKEKADNLLSCNIYSGEIILSKMGDPVGRACIIPNNLKRCVMASDGIRLVVDEKRFSKYFIFSLINSKRIRKAIENKATGSTRKRIGLNDLKKLKLILPNNIQEQQKIASCLSSIDELITAEAEKIEQLEKHKKGLMQGLFPIMNDEL